MDKDVDAAKMILERLCSARLELNDIPPSMRARTWDELRTEEIAVLTEAAGAIREASLNGDVEQERRRFCEAVERAWRQMVILETIDAAAWYTLRDWLKDQGAIK